MPLLSTFGAASARGFGNLSGIALPSDSLFNTVSFLSHFDGTNNGTNNSYDDGSASNHTITASGTVTQGSFGPFARPEGYWGVNFDGSTTGYISVPTDTDFDLTNATTLEFWVFIPEDQTDVLVLGRHGLYWFGADYAGGGGSANKFSFLVMPDGSSTFSAIHSSANIVHNQWYFVQLIYSGTTVTFYLDGASQGTLTSFTPEAGLSKPFYVGGYGGQLNANSILSNIRFSNVARSTSVPTAPFAIDSNTKLLLCSSNRFTDRSSQAAVVTPYAGASVSSFGPFLTTSVYDPAVNGASAYFDGSDSDLVVADNSDVVATGDYTLDVWLYPTNNVQRTHNPSIYRSGTTQLYMVSSGNPLRWYADGVDIQSSSLDLNSWNHVAAVRYGTGSNNVSLYVNGVRKGQGTNTGTMGSSSNNRIGSYSGTTGEYDGYICDLRLLVGTALYTGSTYTIPTAPLTAITNTKLLLNMQDGQAIDSAAQNNLTLYGNAKLSTTQAKFGDTSLYLDGTGDYAYVYPKYFTFGTGDFTVEFQLYLNAGTTQSVVSFLSADGTVAPHFYITSTGTKLLYYVGGVGTAIDGGGVNTGQWYHVALSRSGTSSKLFLDGTQVGSTYSDSNNYVAGPLALGTYKWPTPSTGSLLNGFIDEVRISKMARYTSNFTAPDEPFADKG